MDSQVVEILPPQGVVATALTFGIIEGAKKNIVPINVMLTILRSCISRPLI
jgi:hypothetical protein